MSVSQGSCCNILIFYSLQDIGSNKIRIGVLSFDAQANILLPLEQGISEAVVMAAIESQEDPTEVGKILLR